MNRTGRWAALLSFLSWLLLGCGIGAALLFLFARGQAADALHGAKNSLRAVLDAPAAFLNGASPLILGALAAALAYRGGLWNAGAVGQFILGAAIAAAGGQRGSLHWSVCLLLGLLGGALCGGLIGLLKTRFRVHEALSGLLLLGLCQPLAGLLSASPFQGRSAALPALRFLRFVSLQEMTVGVLLAAFCAAAVWVFLKYTTLGYELRLCGRSLRAGQAAGVDIKRHCLLLMLFSGALAGLGGACFALTPALGGAQAALSWGALTVPAAFLAACHPLAALGSGLLIRFLMLLAGQDRIGLAAALSLIGGMLYAASLSGALRSSGGKAVRREKREEEGAP